MSLLGIYLAVTGRAQQLQSYELREASDKDTAKLVALVDGREVNVATGVLRVWKGWHSSILLYTQALNKRQRRLSYFNAVTGRRLVVTTESSEIADVTVAQLDARVQPVLVLSLRDPSTGQPAVALADPETGVFRRDASATAGPILDTVLVIRYSQDRSSREERVAYVPLSSRLPGPAGIYRGDSTETMMVLHQDGSAILRGVPEHPNQELRGDWNEDRNAIAIEFSNGSVARWRHETGGLVPLRWDPKLLGTRPLSFSRVPAPKQ